ncbi:Uncharacterised protein [Legionella steigerwaltii]|uniref:Uncharacterized protein n=1 Tax=Legionella steigerwaltii TaxID=460 RepID=A0A378LCR0_9GAMM|nr:hypothetical protein Lstg_2919 [Legionella steigerwaltii]STY24467.1 Uncharacterised protein [Legionella steigerwaltii]
MDVFGDKKNKSNLFLINPLKQQTAPNVHKFSFYVDLYIISSIFLLLKLLIDNKQMINIELVI